MWGIWNKEHAFKGILQNFWSEVKMVEVVISLLVRRQLFDMFILCTIKVIWSQRLKLTAKRGNHELLPIEKNSILKNVMVVYAKASLLTFNSSFGLSWIVIYREVNHFLHCKSMLEAVHHWPSSCLKHEMWLKSEAGQNKNNTTLKVNVTIMIFTLP